MRRGYPTDPGDADVAGPVGGYLGAGRHPAALFQADGHASAAPRPEPVPPGWPARAVPAGLPPEPPDGGLEDGGQPLVIEVTEAEAQRAGVRDVRQLVDVRLAREGVGGRGERTVRALRVRGIGRLVTQAAVGHRV